jgi:hypothetical protein
MSVKAAISYHDIRRTLAWAAVRSASNGLRSSANERSIPTNTDTPFHPNEASCLTIAHQSGATPTKYDTVVRGEREPLDGSCALRAPHVRW